MENDLKNILLSNYKFVEKNGYKGNDPQLFWHFYFAKKANENPTILNKVIKKVEYQVLKQFPSYIENYATKFGGYRQNLNPYGLALFIQAFIKMYYLFDEEKYLDEAIKVARILDGLLIETKKGKAVGNPPSGENTKKKFFKGYADNNTVYLPGSSESVHAFLDLYEATKNWYFFDISKSITDSIMYDFAHRTLGDNQTIIDYSNVNDGSHILNANSLAGAAIARVYNIQKDTLYANKMEGIFNYLEPYLEYDYIPYSGIEDKMLNKRNWDSSDVYHTGFFLRGLYDLAISLNRDTTYIIKKIHEMFILFLDKNNNIKMLSNRKNNILDIHGIAEYIFIYSIFRYSLSKNLINKYDHIIYENIKLFLNEDKTYYFYQINNNKKIDIYMPRWAQSPMMNAISSLLLQMKKI